jgi:2-polyprenyl-6-methoxyphenol hydroxylase-like FAD-dependent oxidoreductase
MRQADVAIVGAGLAGATAAAMLGRAGIPTVLIDPRERFPFDFRVEKIAGGEQLERFRRTGLAETVLPLTTHDREIWIARFGYLLGKMPSQQFGIMYDSLVNAIRDEVRSPAEFVCAKVTAISTSRERQQILLSNGEAISARLVMLANGSNLTLRRSLGIGHEITSACHSISAGFDVTPLGRTSFDFPAMTYFWERPSHRISYLALFPVGNRMRANLFAYRQLDDPWVDQLRRRPIEAIDAVLPRLRRITGKFEVSSEVKIRPIDLYVSTNHRQHGVVMVGDAFANTCPVTGTGTDKVFTDVERLCNVHIPAWLASPGMSDDKIASFYDDPVKKSCDDWSTAKAFDFRSVSTDSGLYWRAQRWARFVVSFGKGMYWRLG